MGSISYNVRQIPDKAKLSAHLRTLHDRGRLKAILFYHYEIQYARMVKQAYPDCAVILRHWPDEDIHNRMTPEQWLGQYAPAADGGLILYTTNEPGWSDKLIDWHVRLLELCPPSIQLCILNLGVGQPQPAQWPRAARLLQLAAKRGDILGLHEYAGGVITSGFLGGWPDNAGVAPTPENKGKGRDLTTRWPSAAEAATMTTFHCGRWRFLRDYAKDVGLVLPRIVITEHGFDFTSDIGTWLNNLPRTAGYSDINGWRTLETYWRRLFPQWDATTACFQQLAYANETLYDGVLAQLVFDYADDPNWRNYHVYGALESHLERYNAPVVTPPVVQPPSTPPPVNQPPEEESPTFVEISRENALVLAGKFQVAADHAATQSKQLQALADEWRLIANRP